MPSAADRSVFLAGLALAAATLLAYYHSFSVPFLFDDGPGIAQNASIEHLWPLSTVLHSPADGRTVSGRPLLNFSLAVNRAIGGMDVRSYHVLNLAIHFAAGLTLFGISRRTFFQYPLRGRFSAASLPLAFAIALLWMIHPLQTEAVTYIIQRAESLAGLFYLLTLYCFIRGPGSNISSRWYALSFASCALGMACKEIVATAPIIVLLYDRTFVGGSIREALRSRWRYYICLAATWLLLAYLVVGTASRGGTAGFRSELGAWSYALTQTQALVRYLWLAVWPHPLVFDYGTEVVRSLSEAALPFFFLAALGVGVMVALRYRPALGFLGCWFFVILAPSSSFVPVATQTMAEHRMYLPLASVIALFVAGLFSLLGRRSRFVFLAASLALGFLTVRRNRDYQSALSLWTDTVAKRPTNARAHFNLALVLAQHNETDRAIAEYQAALRLNGRNAEVHLAYANLLSETGRLSEAMGELTVAAGLKPDSFIGHFSVANAFAQQKKFADAIAEYEEALRLRPDYSLAHVNLGNALLMLKREPEAVSHYEEALRLNPSSFQSHYNLATTLAAAGQPEKAVAHYCEALNINPEYADTHSNFGDLLVRLGRFDEAVAQYKAVARLEPSSASAHEKLAEVFSRTNRPEEAAAQYATALQLRPENAEAHYNLGNILSDLGRTQEALAHFAESLRLNPNQADPHTNIGTVLAQSGRVSEALPHFETAVKIDPHSPSAHGNLASALVYLGRLVEARRECEEALRIDPQNTAAKDILEHLLNPKTQR